MDREPAAVPGQRSVQTHQTVRFKPGLSDVIRCSQ